LQGLELWTFLIDLVSIRDLRMDRKSKATAYPSGLTARAGARDDKLALDGRGRFRFRFENTPGFLSIRLGRFVDGIGVTDVSNRQHCRLKRRGRGGAIGASRGASLVGMSAAALVNIV
jgi:hypothetical protein